MVETKKNLVPALRFPQINTLWAEDKLSKRVTKVGSGVTPKGGASVYINQGVPLIRSQNVSNGRLNLNEIAYIPPEMHKAMSGSKVLPGDVLLNITGASIGRSCVVPESLPEANVNQHVCIIRLKENTSPEFLQTYLSSWRGQKAISQSQAGGGREGLNFENIRTFKICFPDIEEQQKIAAFLCAVDDKLTNLRRKRELLESYKRGLMQQLFSQQVRFKQDDGSDFPDWEQKTLNDVATFLKGREISKTDIVDDGKIDCIRYGELYTVYSETIDKVVSKTNLKTKKLVFSRANDVIIPASGETRIDIATAACVIRDDIALGGDLNIIRSKLNGVFLSYYLNSYKKYQIARMAQGISVMHLYSSQLKLLKIEVPHFDEQQKIADFLQSVDKKIDAVAEQITQLDTFKKGLLQKLFV